MALYQFLFLERDGSLSSAEMLECANDLDALDTAVEVCGRDAVEVWIGKRRVFTLKASVGPSSSADRVQR